MAERQIYELHKTLVSQKYDDFNLKKCHESQFYDGMNNVFMSSLENSVKLMSPHPHLHSRNVSAQLDLEKFAQFASRFRSLVNV